MTLCECGCGQPTRIIEKNHTRTGARKGEYYRFVRGHAVRRQILKGYQERGCYEGKQTIHRLRAEHALGKPLPPRVVVHHADGSKRVDAPLVICQDQSYHSLLHVRMRALADGWNPNTHHRCKGCTYKPHAAFCRSRHRVTGLNALCRDCDRQRYQKYHTPPVPSIRLNLLTVGVS